MKFMGPCLAIDICCGAGVVGTVVGTAWAKAAFESKKDKKARTDNSFFTENSLMVDT
jgi:hypothetical protein